jgi:hypothetical protein
MSLLDQGEAQAVRKEWTARFPQEHLRARIDTLRRAASSSTLCASIRPRRRPRLADARDCRALVGQTGLRRQCLTPALVIRYHQSERSVVVPYSSTSSARVARSQRLVTVRILPSCLCRFTDSAVY